MSNQVFSGSVSRFFPTGGERDIFTLIKTVPGTPPIGKQGKAIQTFADLFWDRLNGNDTSLVSGVQQYSPYQSPQTKPYWTLSANSSVLGGATVLYSNVDNDIEIEAVVPCGLAYSAAGNPYLVKLAAVVLDPANGFATVAAYGLNGMNMTTVATTTPQIAFTHPLSVSSNIFVKAGYCVVIRAFLALALDAGSQPAIAPGITLHMQDDTNGSTTSILIPCSLRFAKL